MQRTTEKGVPHQPCPQSRSSSWRVSAPEKNAPASMNVTSDSSAIGFGAELSCGGTMLLGR